MTSCPKCQSTQIEEDEYRGVSVCATCGEVLNNNMIVSEITFTNERSVVEQYVGADGQISSGIHGHSKSSLTITINHGRSILQSLSNRLNLSSQHTDAALAYYKMAAEHRFITGRRSDDVAACCLYTVCREGQSMHMLLDFADQLKINVYKLAATFLKLRLKLKLNLSIVDPVIFVPRFANELNFGDKRREVGRTAIRIVSRMKRDWLHIGRRPAGVCGAALLIAARMHGFSRTQKEVVKAVKVCTSTIRDRLYEFANTPTAKLDVDEFMSIDLNEEADPPSFQRNEAKEQLAIQEAEQLASSSTFSALDQEEPLALTASASTTKNILSSQEPDSGLAMSQDENASNQIVPTTSKSDDTPQGVVAIQEEWSAPTGEVDLDDEDEDDDDISKYILNDEEVVVKTQQWKDENQEYMELMEQKRKEALLGKGTPRGKRKSTRIPPHMQKQQNAAERLQSDEQKSTRINYAALDDLFDDGGPEAKKGKA